MTGYVKKRDGLHIWVPRRAYDKPTFPGELDNTVAGGQPAHIGIFENLIKECAEEASIPRALAEQAKAVGVVAYWNQSGRQLKPDVMPAATSARIRVPCCARCLAWARC